MADPDTWWSLVWSSVDILAGWLLTLAPVGLIAWGLFGVVMPAVWHPIVTAHGNNWYAFIHVTTASTAWLSAALGIAFIALGLMTAPWFLRRYAALARSLQKTALSNKNQPPERVLVPRGPPLERGGPDLFTEAIRPGLGRRRSGAVAGRGWRGVGSTWRVRPGGFGLAGSAWRVRPGGFGLAGSAASPLRALLRRARVQFGLLIAGAQGWRVQGAVQAFHRVRIGGRCARGGPGPVAHGQRG